MTIHSLPDLELREKACRAHRHDAVEPEALVLRSLIALLERGGYPNIALALLRAYSDLPRHPSGRAEFQMLLDLALKLVAVRPVARD